MSSGGKVIERLSVRALPIGGRPAPSRLPPRPGFLSIPVPGHSRQGALKPDAVNEGAGLGQCIEGVFVAGCRNIEAVAVGLDGVAAIGDGFHCFGLSFRLLNPLNRLYNILS